MTSSPHPAMTSSPHPVMLLLLLSLAHSADFTYNSRITRIAFASCSHQDKDQPLWTEIARWDPDYFIWLGDAVYADTRVRPFAWQPPSIPRYSEQLHKMKHNPGYSSFLKRRTKVLGVWDDHDYGVNDGGASDLTYTAAVQDMFLDFLDEPAESPRRHRHGLYGSYLLGKEGRTIKLILIDSRSQLNRETQSVLGAAQWAWLEEELKSDPSLLTIVGTGLPLLTERSYLDKWLLYPRERERLLGLLSRRPNTLIISGDSHFAEIQCINTTRGPIFEIQSSGMTHNCLDYTPEVLCRYYIQYVSECNGCIVQPYIDLNYGTITMQWGREGATTRAIIEIRGRKGVVLHYVYDVGREAHCPAKHHVPHQIAWQLVAVCLITITLLLLLYLAVLLSSAIYARVILLYTRYKPHQA